MQSESQLELPLGRQAVARSRARRAVPPAPVLEANGVTYLGRALVLRLDGARERAELCGDALFLPLPSDAGGAQVRDRAQGWLQGEAKRVLDERLAACASRLAMPPPAWQLAFCAGMKIGTDAGGRLRLPWRLVQLAPEAIDRRLLGLLEPLRARAEMGDLWDAAPLSA